MNNDVKTGIVFVGAIIITAWLLTHAGPAAQVIKASSGGFATAVNALEPPANQSGYSSSLN